MHDSPIVQNVSPADVVKILLLEPYGTYVIRRRSANDDIVSSVQLNKRSTTSQDYVVLSVHVDHILYTSPVMNYRLTYTQENTGKLLEPYYFEQKQSKTLPILKRQLILPTEAVSWKFDHRQLQDLNFSKCTFGGNHNNGLSNGIWQRPKQHDIKIFVKRFDRNSSYYHNELNLLKHLSFFPIITLYGHFSDQHNNYLVFAHGGRSLESVCPIRAQAGESNMRRIARIAFQISTAMIYLEKKNIVHRDLTAGNVLIDDHGFIRIADFGHAILKEEGKNNLSRSLTNNGQDRFQVRFLAPECMQKRSPQAQGSYPSPQEQRQLYASFTSKSDVWSFGILLIQLMLNKSTQPYSDIKDDNDIPQHIKIKRKMHPRPDDCNIDLYYILQQCWAYEPINRISFTDIRSKMTMQE